LSYHQSEEQFVAGLKSQTAEAFEMLYSSYNGALFSVILGLLKDEAAAEDALQEVFVKIWKNADAYQAEKSRLFTWMVNIARNHAIDKLRSKKRLQQHETGEVVREGFDVAGSVPFTDGIGLKKMVEELGDEQREIIEMLYYKGYTHIEAAEELNLPLGTVKSRLRLGINKLRKYFN
jgi:RNA polymerase sigma-70 factor (ECF subfamily)